VPNDGGDEGPLYSQHCDRPVDALRVLSGYETKLGFEPGTEFRYSSYGWILVRAAVEAAAHEPFLLFVQKEVFDALGLHDTTAEFTREQIANLATPYFPRFAADPRYGLQLMRPIEYSCYAGASVFVSTASDLVRFALAINAGKLLRPATVRLLHTSQRLASGQETGYGLGWDIGNATLAGKPTRWVGHEGTSLGGRMASLITFPDRRLAVAVTSNISYTDTESVALKIAQVFASQP
jgi:CubicO group peptidase (beta-lactamase class C family)